MWVKFFLYTFWFTAQSFDIRCASDTLQIPHADDMLKCLMPHWCPISLLRQDWWQICKIDENRRVQNPPKSWTAVELLAFEAWRWKGPWGNFTILQHGSLLHPRVNHQRSPKIAGKSKHLKRPSKCDADSGSHRSHCLRDEWLNDRLIQDKHQRYGQILTEILL